MKVWKISFNGWGSSLLGELCASQPILWHFYIAYFKKPKDSYQFLSKTVIMSYFEINDYPKSLTNLNHQTMGIICKARSEGFRAGH